VRVNAVAPGGIASSGFDTYSPDAQAKILAFPPTVPLQRFGTESEISAAIVYLLSAAAAYVTGACLRVGGAPNARRAWPLATAQHNPGFNGFHRSIAPELLRNKV
jgi:citronellol/citronellal dehydrogenase